MPPLLSLDGKPTFLLGINYWSRCGGPRMWDRFDDAAVQRELAQMRSIGLNVCRSFAFIPSFMPKPPALSRVALRRFRRFLELCHAEELATIPTFLVGHMSGENYDFPGQRGRSPYSDRTVLGWEKRLIRGVAGLCADHPAVAGYLASNEMPYWAGSSAGETVARWAGALRSALRQVDAERPFGLGDGVMNLRGGQNGFDVATLRGSVDFFGPHTYTTDVDPIRQAHNAEYCLRSLTHLGMPVLLEEFGCSACQASEENQRLYYREVIHSCLSVGAAGALGWCFSDFDLAGERPYVHHAFELGFGITRSDGSEKPVCEELRATSALLERIDYARLEHPRPNAAILVPSYFNTPYPFSVEDHQRMRRTLLQAYALCAGAGLEAELVPEGKELSPYRLVLCPSTQKLLATTWLALLAHASAGGTVYWSYFSGDHAFHQGAWCHLFEELTGCRHALRYGCFDLPEPVTRLEGSGLRLEISTQVGPPYPRSLLPLETLSAEVLARDSLGRPALTAQAHGPGEILFLAYPWEYYLAEQHLGIGDGSSYGLYRLIAERAGLTPEVRGTDPGVQLREVRAPRGRLLWVINRRWEDTSTTIDSPGGRPIHGSGEALSAGSCRLTLAPKQITVYRLA